MPKKLLIGLKVAVSAGVLFWLLNVMDTAELLAGARKMKPGWFAASVVLGFATMAVCALRWWRINRFLKIRLPLWFCELAYFEAITISLLMPGSTAGDIVRAVRVGRRSKNYRRAIAATVFDRLGNLGAIAILGAAMLPYLLYKHDLEEIAQIVVVCIGLAIIATGLVFVLPAGSRWRRNRWYREVLKFVLLFRRTFANAQSAAEITVLSLAGLGGTAGMLYCAVLSAGIQGSHFIEIAGAAVLGIIASAIPVSIAGLGVREGAVIWALYQFGYSQTDAYLVAFAFGAALMLQSVPGMIVWLSGVLDLTNARQDPETGPR